jgi:hypothetical protein
MFDDIFGYFNNLLSNIELSENFLNALTKAYEMGLKTLEEANSRASTILGRNKKVSQAYINGPVFEYCFQTILELAPTVLSEEIIKAAESTDEYNNSQLLTPLLTAAESLDNFEFFENRNGWASSISCEVNLDRSAGSIEQWAAAVTYVRNTILHSKNKDGMRASKYWQTKVYGTPLQQVTLADRFAAAGAIAPYWELLDKGNMNVGMSSDWPESYAYPTNSKTNFTGKTATRLKSLFRSEMLAQKEALTQQTQNLEQDISQLESYIDQLSELIQLLNELDLEKIKDIIRYYDSIGKKIDPIKLIRAVRETAAGIEERYRFELAPSKGIRVRATRGRIQRFIKGV